MWTPTAVKSLSRMTGAPEKPTSANTVVSFKPPREKKKRLVLASLDVALIPEHIAPCVFEVNIPVYLHLIHFTTGHAARTHICRIANDGEVLSCADLGRVTSNWHDVLERAVEL